jgi:putative acyl-CoA dehydrogenase
MNDVIAAAQEASNQPPALEGYDAFTHDPWLRAAAERNGVADMARGASELGRYVGSAEAQHHATLANRYTPELHTHDRFGKRIDVVEYHPSYHVLMKRAIGAGVHSIAWTRPERGFSAHAVLFYLWNQLEQGTACPMTMTFASLPVFSVAPLLDREWRAKVLSTGYDARMLPVRHKDGATIGMAMTEKQGGSDLRAAQTRAEQHAGEWRLTGHKWFCSAPMSDAFFTLARAPQGVTCFFVPRTLPDGRRNAFLLQRLKEKCGNRSNASSEVEYANTAGWLVGEPGRGISTLIAMAHHTRFDIVVGVAGMMRAALNQAVHHASFREAFGKRLIEQPLMVNVLADLALEAEAAMLLAFRLAAAFDASGTDAREASLQRALTPIAKYWLCKRMTPVATEAMECLGGNGYVEEAPLARLYREAPLNGIWEGSANVICLDVLRALSRSPEARDALWDEIAAARDPRLESILRDADRTLADPATAEGHARRVVERLATGMAASLMLRHGSAEAAEVFCASRLEGGGGAAFGALAAEESVLRKLVDRARLQAA